MKIMFSWL